MQQSNLKFFNRREQRRNLKLVAADISPGLGTAMPRAIASSTVRTMSFAAELLRASVAEIDQLGKFDGRFQR